ncbi:MAG: hypothetical protein KJO07_17085 [Deltaproteobacteria bacterium]|nr:hypothetical protein [Deltaproteobacteria bacterium]
MRAKLLILILSCCLLAESARAEDPLPEPQWTVQVDPLTVALGFVHVQLERALSEKISVYAGPSIRLWDLLGEDDDPSYYGIGLEAGVRFYVRGRAPVGTWLMVRGVGAYIADDNDNTDLGGYASVLVGHHFTFGRWLLGAGIGVQYLHYTVDGTGTEGVLPAAHTTVGAVF